MSAFLRVEDPQPVKLAGSGPWWQKSWFSHQDECGQGAGQQHEGEVGAAVFAFAWCKQAGGPNPEAAVGCAFRFC